MRRWTGSSCHGKGGRKGKGLTVVGDGVVVVVVVSVELVVVVLVVLVVVVLVVLVVLVVYGKSARAYKAAHIATRK